MGKKEKQNGFFVVVRSRSEEESMVKNGLMLVASLPLRTRMMSGAGLLSRTMTGGHTAAGVWADAHVATKDKGMPRVLANTCHHIGVTTGRCWFEYHQRTWWYQPELLPGTMSVFMAIPQPRCVLMPVAVDTIKGHANARHLGCSLVPCGYQG